ncbi:hypothetical protein [Halorubrum tebenquichense]|uniref:hypothetical protein n=1 Tax=Halorubrum tebenquichense TaxID=119434 RepID=UPI0012695E8C|nr:hypothetical protein [Halorubrum tebenquichense]
MPRVPVVVPPEQKERWSDYAEGHSEVDNVSDLVRTSVELYIAQEGDEDGWSEEELDTIIEYLDSIESRTNTTQAILEDFRAESPDTESLEEYITYQRASIQQVVKETIQEELSGEE